MQLQSFKIESPIMWQSTPQILMVDDEPTTREFLSLILRYKGMEVTEVENGLEALREFEEQPNKFNLLVTDLHMPKMDGKELISTLKKVAPSMPMILCSSLSQEKLGKGDEDHFFKKPYPVEEFEQKVMCLLMKN